MSLQASLAAPRLQAIFALVVFCAALWLVRRDLGGVSIAAIGATLSATSPLALGACALATAVSFLCLVAPEAWALASIGRRLPVGRVTIATLAIYALANGLGFGLATGGAARLRFYRSWGLAGAEVAAVTALAGVAVTVSGLATAGLALSAASLGSRSLATAGAGVLLAVPALLLFLGRLPRAWRLAPGVAIASPSAGRGAAALIAGLIDWTLSAAALFVLIPGAHLAQFPAFVVVFVLGSVLGALSGAPGGVGVFEAVMLALSHRFGQVHETAAALLLYRLIYVLGPLSLTAIALALQQTLSKSIWRAALVGWERVLPLAPTLIAALVFAVGAGLLMAGANLPIRPFRGMHLLQALPAGRLVTSLLGALLLMTSHGLWRRQEAAFGLTLGLLVVGAVLEIQMGFGLVSAAPLVLLLGVMMACRSAFNRRSALYHDTASGSWWLAVSLTGVSALMLAFYAQRGSDLADKPWWSLLALPGAAGPLGVACGVASLGAILGLARLLGPEHAQDQSASPAEVARARGVILATRTVVTDAFLALLGDKRFVFSPTGLSFVMYRPCGRHWVAMSGPVGPATDRAAAIAAFLEAAEAVQARPLFYALDESGLSDMIDAGFIVHKIGENAEVPLAAFDLHGKARQQLRHAVNVQARAGLMFTVLAADDPATPWDQLGAVSDQWLAAHTGAEKSFSLGRFDRAYLANFPLALLSGPQGVVAFANLWATPDGRRLSPDLMRYGSAAPYGAMDALFAHLMVWGRDHGFETFELGMAPLAGLAPTSVSTLAQKAEAWIFRTAETLYGFRGLRAYKEKFAPVWRPAYLAAPAVVNPLAALADVALLTSGWPRSPLGKPARSPGRRPITASVPAPSA